MEDVERMLEQTVQNVEFHNLMELLPTEVEAWWEARKQAAELAARQEQTDAQRFFEERVAHWKGTA